MDGTSARADTSASGSPTCPSSPRCHGRSTMVNLLIRSADSTDRGATPGDRQEAAWHQGCSHEARDVEAERAGGTTRIASLPAPRSEGNPCAWRVGEAEPTSAEE